MINHASVTNPSVLMSSLASTRGQSYEDSWQGYLYAYQSDEEVYNKVSVTRINGRVTHGKVMYIHINVMKVP